MGLCRSAVTRTRMADCWTEGGFAVSRRSRSVSIALGEVKRCREGGCRRRMPWRRESTLVRWWSTVPGWWERRELRVVRT